MTTAAWDLTAEAQAARSAVISAAAAALRLVGVARRVEELTRLPTSSAAGQGEHFAEAPDALAALTRAANTAAADMRVALAAWEKSACSAVAARQPQRGGPLDFPLRDALAYLKQQLDKAQRSPGQAEQLRGAVGEAEEIDRGVTDLFHVLGVAIHGALDPADPALVHKPGEAWRPPAQRPA